MSSSELKSGWGCRWNLWMQMLSLVFECVA